MRSHLVKGAELLVLPAVIIAVWWIASAGSQSVFFPPLQTIIEALFAWLPEGLIGDIVPSVTNLLLGYALAVLVGVSVGMLLGRVRVLQYCFSPIIEFARSIPPAALLPFFILGMGPTDTMRITVIALGAMWPTLLSTMDGVRGIDPEVLDVTRVYKTSRWRRVFRVILPAASPLILAGMKTSLAFAVILVVVSEMLASTEGIGYFIISAQQYFNLPDLWAGTIVMGILGYLLSEILFFAERRILVWKGDI